ncbi:MAG TPA: 4'-phosphopantetheinyl transferase superfamily protein [Candidatus Binatia bacterium]|nr:4'-phosphopantetheinyl transferase superfamily protein [Candidatus Binatia bacterium]
MDERNSRCAAVWLLDIRRVTEFAVAGFEQRLAASEAYRYSRFARKQRKRQFLVGRMLLRLAVSKMMNVPVHAITVIDRVGSAPKLFFAGGQSAPPNFSISHSGNWVGCALSTDVMLGFDLEVNHPDRDIVALSQAAFEPDEQLWLMQQPDADRIAAFYRLWSTREALYKLMSSLGREMPSSSLKKRALDHDDSQDWHHREVVHNRLTGVLCSDKSISRLLKVVLAELTSAVLLASA